eukprot:2955211-Alexandrium_andersonii.AAC.1
MADSVALVSSTVAFSLLVFGLSPALDTSFEAAALAAILGASRPCHPLGRPRARSAGGGVVAQALR